MENGELIKTMKKNKENKTVALIDADILLYKFSFRNTDDIDWGDGVVTEIRNVDKAFEELIDFAEEVQREVEADEILYCLSSKENFRYAILPSYKGNRKKTEPPPLKAPLKELIKENLPYKIKEGLEADDLMGILLTINPDKYTCCSIDKDLRTVQGKHYNWNYFEDGVVIVSKAAADRFFYKQCLMGDATDGYSGCPRVGAVKADKILDKAYQNYSELVNPKMSLEQYVWQMITYIYEQHSLDVIYAFKQARMARILRAEDFNFKTNKPIYWKPR